MATSHYLHCEDTGGQSVPQLKFIAPPSPHTDSSTPAIRYEYPSPQIQTDNNSSPDLENHKLSRTGHNPAAASTSPVPDHPIPCPESAPPSPCSPQVAPNPAP